MKRKRTIKRFFLTLMWLGVAIGMGTVITAAMRVQEAGICEGYNIRIDGFKKDMLFTSKDQIISLLKTAVKGNITGQRRSQFDLPAMEDLLEQSSWVYNADLYFDNNNILHANVTERKPLARVFTSMGTSFYIDEAGKHIPLSTKISLDLPVFTGYPSKKIMNSADSVLMQNIIATASFISTDSFWNKQVAQVNINNCGADCWNMEMIPVVGNHKVDLGDGTDIASKFHRLYLFYDQVLKRTGFDKYQKIDVQYNGQVIAVKDDNSKVDILQLRKNIEQLLQQSREYNEMVQIAPATDYAKLPKKDLDALAADLPDNLEPLDSVLNNDEPKNDEVEKETKIAVKKEVKEAKKEIVAAPVVVKKSAIAKPAKTVTETAHKNNVETKKETKKEVKKLPKEDVKKETKKAVKPIAVEKKTEKHTLPPTKTNVLAKTELSKKTDVKKTSTGKLPPEKKVVKKEEVKRNVLSMPEASKKTGTKKNN